MRTSLLVVFLAACGHAAPASAPTNSTTSALGRPAAVDVTKLGGLVLIPSVGENAVTFAPHADVFAFDTNKVAATGSTWTLVGTGGEHADVTAGAPLSLPYGCDNNQLEGMPLTSTGARLPAGVAWMMPATSTLHPSAMKIERGAHDKLRETYKVGEMTLKLERTERSKGVATVMNRGTSVELRQFQRVIMEGADPALETIDFSDADMRLQIPVPVAAWSLSPSGPYLLVMHTEGFEGATLETFLVETSPKGRATKIEAMTVYLYQCAF